MHFMLYTGKPTIFTKNTNLKHRIRQGFGDTDGFSRIKTAELIIPYRACTNTCRIDLNQKLNLSATEKNLKTFLLMHTKAQRPVV